MTDPMMGWMLVAVGIGMIAGLVLGVIKVVLWLFGIPFLEENDHHADKAQKQNEEYQKIVAERRRKGHQL